MLTTAVDLVRFYLRRIAALDQAGPALNAVLALHPDAEAMASALDAERRRGRTRGPLHGIPVLLKDNLETKDMPTTGGCLALSGRVPRAMTPSRSDGCARPAPSILGKVNLHELALGLTTVSSLGGQTLNPYDLARTPGGSSGGSGVAAAANFAAFTIGTDTSGSIRIPSSHNAIVGLRPSAGLSSRSGVIPFGHTQDTAGPMARTVTDVALVLDATVGPDAADAVTAAAAGKIADQLRVVAAARCAARRPRGRAHGVLRRPRRRISRWGPSCGAPSATWPHRARLRIDVSVPNLAALLAASNLLCRS